MAASEKQQKPTCFAEFCFDTTHPLITEEDFVKRYGKGHKESIQGGIFVAYCYRVPQEKLFIRFRPHHADQREIMDIFVSDVPNCPAAKPPKTAFRPLTTVEGLKIGDPYEKVLSLYGTPDATRKADGLEKIGLDFEKAKKSTPFGDKLSIYWPNKNTSQHAEVYIRDGKVAAILISVHP